MHLVSKMHSVKVSLCMYCCSGKFLDPHFHWQRAILYYKCTIDRLPYHKLYQNYLSEIPTWFSVAGGDSIFEVTVSEEFWNEPSQLIRFPVHKNLVMFSTRKSARRFWHGMGLNCGNVFYTVYSVLALWQKQRLTLKVNYNMPPVQYLQYLATCAIVHTSLETNWTARSDKKSTTQ